MWRSHGRRRGFYYEILAAAHKLNDFDLGAALDGSARPQVPLDDRPVQFDRHPFRLEVKGPNHVEQSRLRRKITNFAVECNLIFS
jgi:hypothetical protein